MIRVLLMKFLEDCGAHRTHGLPLLARTWRGTLPGETFGRRHLILLQDLIEDLGGAARLSDVDAIGSLEGPFLTMVGVVGHFWEGSSLMRIRLASPFEIADAFLSTGASEGLSSCEFQGRSGDYLVVVREDALVVPGDISDTVDKKDGLLTYCCCRTVSQTDIPTLFVTLSWGQ